MRSTRLSSLAAIGCAALLASFAHAQAPLTARVTYQGVLKHGGAAIDELCDFEFGLFDAVSGGTQVGSTLPLLSVSVVDGLFTVELDFGTSPFAGEARWLEIAVRRPAGSGGYVALSPRQPLSATPYALFAMGAPWSGLTGVPAGFADGVDNLGGLVLPYAGSVSDPGTAFSITNSGAGRAIDATSSGGVAIRAQIFGDGLAVLGLGTIHGSTGSSNTSAAGIRGEATNSSGLTYGVYGTNESSSAGASGILGAANAGSGETFGVVGLNGSTTANASGVFGWSTATSGATFGVEGLSASTAFDAAGVRGTATAGSANGVIGLSSSPAAGATGVWARATAAAGTGATFGVYGETAGDGVTSTGVFGYATNAAPAGSTYGVYGRNDSGVATARGAVGFASSAAPVVTFGVQGQTNASGAFAAGVYGLGFNAGAFQIYGVRGQTTSTLAAAAGVLAQGNGALAPGVPSAAAVEIRNGAIRVSGGARPAGSVCPAGEPWLPIESCYTSTCIQPIPPHSHTIGWHTDLPLLNPLIVAPPNCGAGMGSLIQVSVETEFPPPACTSWYAQVHSKAPGFCVIRVTRMGAPACACAPPAEEFWVNYLIVNPAAAGALVGDASAVPVESDEQ